MENPVDPLLEEYLAKTPGETEWVERLARRYRGMTAQDRLNELAELLRWMDAILGGRRPHRDEPRPLWFDPQDPLLERAR
jgi:hypothetical protein